MVGVGVLIREGDRYLIVKRAAEPDAGLWSIPGGLVEVGERTAEAAAREAKEETGLDVEIEDIIGVVDKIVRDEASRVKYHFVIVDYLAKRRGGTVKASSDALEARWVKGEDLPNYELPATLMGLLRRMGIYPKQQSCSRSGG